MTISASDAAATLAHLVPGFVALSVFYWFGVRVKRPDWQWLIGSLIVTVPIAYVSSLIAGLFGATSTDLAESIAKCGTDEAFGVTARPEFQDAVEACAND